MMPWKEINVNEEVMRRCKSDPDFKKARYVYPAIFDYAEDGISVSFPDLPGCLTCGKTDAEALRMAKDALGGHMQMIEYLPEPTQLINISIKANQRTVLITI